MAPRRYIILCLVCQPPTCGIGELLIQHTNIDADREPQGRSTPMVKKKADRTIATLECTENGDRNYTTEKNKRNDPQRLELRKY